MATKTKPRKSAHTSGTRKLQLAHPKLKLARANEQIEEISWLITDYKKSAKTRPKLTRKQKLSKDRTQLTQYFEVEIHPRLPAQLPVLTGEIIHNLRSALDQAAAAAVTAGGTKVGVQHGFPITSTRSNFSNRAKSTLNGTPPGFISRVERLEPFQGGKNEPLWWLHQFNNQDKHEAIILSAEVFRADGMLMKSFPRVGNEILVDDTPGFQFKGYVDVLFHECNRVCKNDIVIPRLVAISTSVKNVLQSLARFVY